MAEPALTPLGTIQIFAHIPRHRDRPLNDHLGDTVSPAYREGCLSVIDHDDLDFSAVVRVNRPGRIEKRHTVVDGKAAPGAYLRSKPSGKATANPVGTRHLSPGGITISPVTAA